MQNIIESSLTDAHKPERKRFANWIRSNFRKEQTMQIFFSNEKLFDIDDVYNVQNDCFSAPSRVDVNKSEAIETKKK